MSLESAANANPEMLLSAALMHELDGDLASAEAAYRQVLSVAPHTPIALGHLADLIVIRGGDPTEAVVCRLDLAAALLDSGHLEEARSVLTQLEAMLPDHLRLNHALRQRLEALRQSLRASAGRADAVAEL